MDGRDRGERVRGRRSAITVGVAVFVAVVTSLAPTTLAAGAAAPPPTGSATTATSAPAAGAAPAARPNVVMIVVDDATYREMPLMPKLQALVAAHGTTFPSYFDSTPICCPARAGILSGQYNTNNHVKDNSSAGKFAHDNQLAAWLHTAGYRTSLIGKYLNGFPCVDRAEIPKGWDRWQQVCDANKSQYDYTLNDDGRKVRYGSRPRDYMVDVLTRRMRTTIRQFSASKKPFFVYVAPTVPHAPQQVPPRYAHTPVPRYPRPAAFNEADMSDKPWLRKVPRIPWSWPVFFRAFEVRRMRMNLAADDMVGAAIDTLTRTHQLGNTVVMVLNDNGFMRGEHRLLVGKGLPYYESVNSGPLYVRGPGFPAGVVNPALVGNIDLAPTITALAHAHARRVMDGVNIMPAVARPQLFADRAFFHLLPQWGGARGVRVGDRYVYWVFDVAYAELYDYRTDPGHTEMQNVAADRSHRVLGYVLGKLLARLAHCKGRGCQLTMDPRGRIGRLPA
jgi:arylsulfatase A-like enzyme